MPSRSPSACDSASPSTMPESSTRWWGSTWTSPAPRHRVLDLGGEAGAVGGHDQQVFGSKVIGDVDGLVHVVRDDDAAVGLADYVRALEPLQEADELFLDAVRELAGVGDEHAPGQRVVLQLGGEIGGDKIRPRLAIRNDDDLRRTGDAIDANRAEHLFLGQGHRAV